MPRIGLRLIGTPDPVSPGITPRCPLCYVILPNDPNNPEGHIAIVDTGAPFSIIPKSYWEPVQKNIVWLPVGNRLRTIKGIGGGEAPCKFGRLKIRLHDGTNISGQIEIRAKLAEKDEGLDFLLGLDVFADKCKLVINDNGQSYIETP